MIWLHLPRWEPLVRICCTYKWRWSLWSRRFPWHCTFCSSPHSTSLQCRDVCRCRESSVFSSVSLLALLTAGCCSGFIGELGLCKSPFVATSFGSLNVQIEERSRFQTCPGAFMVSLIIFCCVGQPLCQESWPPSHLALKRSVCPPLPSFHLAIPDPRYPPAFPCSMPGPPCRCPSSQVNYRYSCRWTPVGW